MNGGRGNDVALLGAGDDTFVWNPGDGSDTVEGQAGLDTMLFNGANINENIDISANGERVRFTRDVANITMDLNGVEHIDFTRAGRGRQHRGQRPERHRREPGERRSRRHPGGTAGDNAADTVEIDGTNGDDVITLSLRADGALVVNGLSEEVVIEHFDPADTIHIDGLGGDDVIDASALGALAVRNSRSKAATATISCSAGRRRHAAGRCGR